MIGLEIIQKITRSLKDGDASGVVTNIDIALRSGVKPEDILRDGLLAGINEVGIRFKKSTIFVPEVLLATRAMTAGMSFLEPYLISTGSKNIAGKILIGTIKGDLHDIGKNLVKVTLEREGFEVKDLGKDVSEEEFVKAYKEFKPHVIGISTLLTSTMGGIQDVIDALDEADVRKNVLVMVGGVPITERFAMRVGADIFAYDANEAVSVLKEKLKDTLKITPIT